MYYIVAFRSRTGAIRFLEALRREGVAASLVNTPRAAGAGCGLSVRLVDLSSARRVLSGGYQAQSGIFAVRQVAGGVSYTRV